VDQGRQELPALEDLYVILYSNEQAIGAETIPLVKTKPKCLNNWIKYEQNIDDQSGQQVEPAQILRFPRPWSSAIHKNIKIMPSEEKFLMA
jgi:hypothetical protein